MSSSKSSEYVLLMFLAFLAFVTNTVVGIGTLKPWLYEPLIASTEIRMTGIDVSTDPGASDLLDAVGTYKSATSEWTVFTAEYDTATG